MEILNTEQFNEKLNIQPVSKERLDSAVRDIAKSHELFDKWRTMNLVFYANAVVRLRKAGILDSRIDGKKFIDEKCKLEQMERYAEHIYPFENRKMMHEKRSKHGKLKKENLVVYLYCAIEVYLKNPNYDCFIRPYVERMKNWFNVTDEDITYFFFNSI